MSRSRHTEAQIIGVLKQLEAGRKAEDLTQEASVSKHTIYAWKAKYGSALRMRARPGHRLSGVLHLLSKATQNNEQQPSTSKGAKDAYSQRIGRVFVIEFLASDEHPEAVRRRSS